MITLQFEQVSKAWEPEHHFCIAAPVKFTDDDHRVPVSLSIVIYRVLGFKSLTMAPSVAIPPPKPFYDNERSLAFDQLIIIGNSGGAFLIKSRFLPHHTDNSKRQPLRPSKLQIPHNRLVCCTPNPSMSCPGCSERR